MVGTALNYNPAIDYKNYPSVWIGKMSIVCKYRTTIKWKNESNGMGFLNGEIILEKITPTHQAIEHVFYR